ncbi:signal peptide peptidase SppA [Pseudidiomarina aestuarii]
MSGIRNVFGKLFGFINGIRKVIVNLVFFIVLFVFVGFLMSGEETIEVPTDGILVLNLNGYIVEEETYVDPVDEFFNQALGSGPSIPEVLLSDVIDSIEQAASDERISGIYLNLSSFMGAGMNKLELIGNALSEFRDSGKPIYTYGDYFSQPQYYLAAHADAIYLNPLGGMMFDGMGGNNLYYKDLLDKLKVSTHVFKVGDYKSAVEPYIRNDMSDEAKEANGQLYGELWETYKSRVTALRNIDPRMLSGTMADFQALVAENNNDLAQLTVTTNVVDELKTREAFRTQMIELTGLDDDEKSWKRINHDAYLEAIEQESLVAEENSEDSNSIKVIVARGIIVDGYQKAGMIGGDSTAELLRRARQDESTKAVVLRIDSPGGSGFASEIIRQEVLELQKAGIPVIASMSSVAASGGYWIAASADEIWAAPTTITGSIGVFGTFFTIEDSLAEIGVYSDGVRTTEMPVMDITQPLGDDAKQIIQLSVEKFYTDFVQMVADSREMSYEEVHAVAQGRVWTGTKALEFGLVDQLGDFEDAIAAAAAKADLTEFTVETLTQELSPRQQMLANFFGTAQAWFPLPTVAAKNPLEAELMRVWSDLQLTTKFNDPNGIYALCELCPTY